MAAFNFHKRQTRRWWYVGATLLVAAFLCVFYVGGAFAIVPGSPSNFESLDANNNANPPLPDGNMTNDVAGHSDWNCFANGVASGFVTSAINVGQTCSSALVPAGAFAKTDPAATTSDDSWVNGTKMDTACAPVGTNKNPPKDDFTNIASYTEQASNKNTYLYGATIRVAPNGNASENVELNQKAGTSTCPINRTAGDHLLAFDYLNGGGSLNLHVLTWIDSTNPTADGQAAPGGKCIIKTDSMPCWGATVISPAAAAFEGDVSQSAITAANNGISGQALTAGEFAEFGVNLTTALSQNPNACNVTSQIDWESRSSGSSFSSNPEDLAIEHKSIANCGQIIIRKVTVPSPDPNNTSFSYSDNIASSTDTFSLKNGGSKDFGSSVLAGSYNANETPNSGYTLSNIDCSASSTGNGSSVTYGTTPDSTFQAGDTKVNISLKPGDVIDCTYTNTLHTATLTTSASTTGTVTPGTAVHDTATVTGSTSTYPTGTVSFFLCGPLKSASGCTSSDSTNTSVGTGGLTNTSTAGKGTATSPDVNSGTALAEGIYCFEATWPGDTTYPGALDATSATNECFTVQKINTQTVTTPNDGSGVSGKETSIILGSSIYDTAVVSGTAAGGDPTGSVEFFVCGPTATSSTQLCDGTTGNVGTDLGSASLAGNGDNTSTATLASPGFKPTATGRYCFRAVYGGSLVYNTSSDSSAGECFTVTQIGTTTTTTPSSNGLPLLGPTVNFGDQTMYDHAVVQAATTGDGTPTGTVTFSLCSPSQMLALSETTCASGGTTVGSAVTLGSALGDSPPDAAADSSAFTNGGSGVNQTGTWCWRAVYTPTGSAYTGSSDSRSTECFTVIDTFTNTSAQTWLPNDTATVTTTYGAPLNGTLDVQLYTGDNCGATSGSAVSGADYQKTLTNATSAADRTLTTSNTTHSFTTSQSVSWLVTFTSTDTNVTGSSHCEKTSLTINN